MLSSVKRGATMRQVPSRNFPAVLFAFDLLGLDARSMKSGRSGTSVDLTMSHHC